MENESQFFCHRLAKTLERKLVGLAWWRLAHTVVEWIQLKILVVKTWLTLSTADNLQSSWIFFFCMKLLKINLIKDFFFWCCEFASQILNVKVFRCCRFILPSRVQRGSNRQDSDLRVLAQCALTHIPQDTSWLISPSHCLLIPCD